MPSRPVRPGCKWLFWSGDGEPLRNVSTRFAKAVKQQLREAAKAAKTAGHSEPDFRPFRFHDLRHRHAVDFLKTGGST